jgi:Lar family restriction alleviation protein
VSEIGMTPTNTATKAGDLLPCPFCGSKTLYVKHEPGTILHPAYYVHCDDCGAQSGAWERGEHIEEWNRRAAAPAEPASAAEGALPAKALVLVTRNQLLNALAFMASEDDEIAIAETEDGLIAYSVDHPEETIDLSDEAPEPAQRASSGDAMALSASELDDFTRRLIERQVPFPPSSYGNRKEARV